MRRKRWSFGLSCGLALALLNTGCKFLERERERDDRAAAPASRTKPGSGSSGGKNWQDGPTPGFERGGVPPADSWADPSDPNFDVNREVRGILAGFVEDPDGRKVRDVYISVEPAEGGKSSGAKVGVQTDPQGYFLIKGLKPRTTYVLTTDPIKIEGRELSGRIYARTTTERSQFLRIVLIEGLNFSQDGARSSSDGREKALAPSVFPDNSLPGNVPSSPSSGPRSDPLLKGRDPATGLPMPAPANSFPEPSGSRSRSSDSGRRSGIPRNDLTVEGPAGIWRPPAANIPGQRGESRAVKPANSFTVLDSLGEPRDLPTGRTGEFLLLDFMTTSCIPCKKAIPALKDLQARYGLSGLEIVAITCDDTDSARRRALASAYQRQEQLNYLVYVEPGAEPGQVARRFGVSRFPTLVLLSHNGDVLWKGHPADIDDLEAVLKDEMIRAKR